MAERQDLALTGGSANVTRPSELFTPKLWTLATSEASEAADRRARILAIAENEALRTEAARVLPELQRMIDGRPSNDELGQAMQPLLVVKRLPDFGPGKEGAALKAAWLAIYYGQLRAFPLQAIRAGVRDVIGTHVYPDMPQPAEIVKAVEPYAIKIRTAHYRLKEALRLDRKPVREVDRKANLEAMRAAGWVDEQGNVVVSRILGQSKGPPPGYRRPSVSPQEMAAKLRSQS